jgi:hypothetical protein
VLVSRAWLGALYVAVGILASQLLNMRVYGARGAKTLDTWFYELKLTATQPSATLCLWLCICVALAVLLLLRYLLEKAAVEDEQKILKHGVIICGILCLYSQVIFSSFMRFAYEVSFGLVVLGGVLARRHLVDAVATRAEAKSALRKELWDLLKIVVSVCLSFPVVVAGTGLISNFYKEEQRFVQVQLYRHLAMAIYFELGMGVFVLVPVVGRLLTLKPQDP